MLAVKKHLLDQFYPFSQAHIKVIYPKYYNLWLMYDYAVVSRASHSERKKMIIIIDDYDKRRKFT